MTKQFNWLLNQYIPNSKCNTPVISRNNAPWWMDLLAQQVSGLRTAKIPTILIQSRNNYCHPSSILALLAAGSISPIIPAIMGLPMAPIIGLLIIGLPIIPRPKAQNLKDQRRVLIKVSGWYVVSIHLHNILIIWYIISMKSTNQPGKVAIGGAHGYGSRLSAVIAKLRSFWAPPSTPATIV